MDLISTTSVPVLTSQSSEISFEKDSEENVLLNQKLQTIKAATVEKLLEKLTEEQQGLDYFYLLISQIWIMFSVAYSLIDPLPPQKYFLVLAFKDLEALLKKKVLLMQKSFTLLS